jgi:hypothetical protein
MSPLGQGAQSVNKFFYQGSYTEGFRFSDKYTDRKTAKVYSFQCDHETNIMYRYWYD